MLVFYKNLYWGESVQKKQNKLLLRLAAGKLAKPGITLITYASNGSDLFDLIPAWEEYFINKKKELFVLGIAGSKEEAEELSGEMICRVYKETGTLNVRDYFGYESREGGRREE